MFRKIRRALAGDENPQQLIAVDGLRVIIVPDGDQWFAQGIDIDFAASGSTIEDVQNRFVQGLCSTLHANMVRNKESMRAFLHPAPNSVIEEVTSKLPRSIHELKFVSVRLKNDDCFEDLPYKQASFIHAAVAA